MSSSSQEIELGTDTEEGSGNNSIGQMDPSDDQIKKKAQHGPYAKKNTHGGGILETVMANLLVILTVIGVIVGSAIGLGLRVREPPMSPRETMYLKFVGELFLRMLKCVTLPLISSSLIAAIGGLDISLSGRIGGRAIAYYVITAVIAVILGIFLALTLRPGVGLSRGNESNFEVQQTTHPADGLLDLIRNMFPNNIIEAAMKQHQTVLTDPKPCDIPSGNSTASVDCVPTHPRDWKIEGMTVDGSNILGLVAFSVALGVSLSILREKGKPVLNFFTSLSDSMLVVTNWAIWFSPVGICFLVAAQLVEEKDILDLLQRLGKYLGTVVLGHSIHGLIILPLIFTLFTKRLPFRFLGNMAPALCSAFGTSSSAAALPVTIHCLEERNGVDHRVTRFLVPIGTTINMDGAALYEAVAVIWIAQVTNVDLTVGKIISLGITAAAASIGAAGIPQGGLVTMSMVLYAIGLPAEYVSYVTPIDWLVDRSCTVINVLGDAVGAGLIYHMNKDHLHELDVLAEQERIETESKMMLADKKLAVLQEDDQE